MLNSCGSNQPNINPTKYTPKRKAVERCSFFPDKKRPLWVDNSSSSVSQNYYFGVGIAGYTGDVSKQIKISEQEAKENLSEQILITIDTKSYLTRKHYRSPDQDTFFTNYRSTLNTKSLNYLTNIQIKDRWLNRQTCELWTLAVVKKSEVEQLKKKISKQIELFYKMWQDYAKAKDKYLPIKSRLKSVDKALHTIEKFDVVLIQQVDFLNKNINYMLWQKKINSLKAQLHREQQIAIKEKNNVLNKVTIGMTEDELVKIIKPKKNSWILSVDSSNRVDSVYYQNKYFILENFRLSCVISSEGFSYDISNDIYHRAVNKNCQWYRQHRENYILKGK